MSASCDGNDLGGATCASLGFPSGSLGCADSCAYDTSACSPSDRNCCEAHAGDSCDDGTCEDLVCDKDMLCCEFEWDESCAATANAVCKICM